MTKPVIKHCETYDRACYALAVRFLEDDDGPIKLSVHLNRAHSLAGAIQETIEEWLEDNRRDHA